MLTVASTNWVVGIVIGSVVIAVAAVIVITIVALARRIAGQAKTAEEAVEVVRSQTAELDGVARINDSGREGPARRTSAPKGCGRKMTPLALSGDTYWTIALSIGLGAAVVVAILLVLLLLYIGRIRRSVEGLLEIAGRVGANTANIPQLEATAPVLAEIVDEAVVQDGYMNALTDGFGKA